MVGRAAASEICLSFGLACANVSGIAACSSCYSNESCHDLLQPNNFVITQAASHVKPTLVDPTKHSESSTANFAASLMLDHEQDELNA